MIGTGDREAGFVDRCHVVATRQTAQGQVVVAAVGTIKPCDATCVSNKLARAIIGAGIGTVRHQVAHRELLTVDTRQCPTGKVGIAIIGFGAADCCVIGFAYRQAAILITNRVVR